MEPNDLLDAAQAAVARMSPDRFPPRSSFVGYQHRADKRQSTKLSWILVREMRRWAQTEGKHLNRKEQSQHLATIYPARPSTIEDVLENESWTDVTYVPKRRNFK